MKLAWWPRNWLAWGAVLLAVLGIAIGSSADLIPMTTPYRQHLAAGRLQGVLLILAAGCFAAWWGGRSRWEARDVSQRVLWCGVVAAMTLYAVGMSALSLIRHQALLTGIWDLGYYAQLTWELSQLQIPRSSIWRDAVWGNHATFILAAAAPFLRLHPDPATLLVLQSVVLALGAVPAYCLGRRVWAQPLAGAVTAGAYLLYPPLQFANLFDFHADTFATPMLLAAFASIFAGRTGWALAWAGLLMMVKEDMALVACTFGLYVAAVHRRPSGLGLAATAVAVFALLIWVVIPSWTQIPYFSVFNRWPHLGNTPWELIASPVLRPDVFFSTFLQPERLGYLATLVVSLAGLPLLAPEVLAVGLPPLVSNLLSSVEMQYTIRGQYTATLTPILFAAATVGGRRAAARLKGVARPGIAVLAGLAAASVAASFAFSPLPWSQDSAARKHFWHAAPHTGLASVLDHVGPEASVSAANHLGAHVALRRTIKMFPDGLDTSDFVLVDVGGLDYVGSSPNPEVFRPLLHRLVDTRPLVVVKDGLALFGRGEPSPDAVVRLVDLRIIPLSTARRAGDFMLVAGSVTPSHVAPREYLRPRYTWVQAVQGRGVPCVSETLISAAGMTIWEHRRPMFHALLAGTQWPAGMAADEKTVTLIPETVSPGTYSWMVATWHDTETGVCLHVPAGVSRVAISDVRIHPW